MTKLHDDDHNFKIGSGIKLKSGKDLAIIATGETVQRAFEACELLKKININCTLISMHTIKPFDEEIFLNSISKVKAVITVEEHSVSGGLGEKCASVMMQKNIHLPFKILGFLVEFMVNGFQNDVLVHSYLSSVVILDVAINLLR